MTPTPDNPYPSVIVYKSALIIFFMFFLMNWTVLVWMAIAVPGEISPRKTL